MEGKYFMENNSTDVATLNQKYNGIDLIKFIMAIFIVMMHSNFMLDISYNINYAFKWGIMYRPPKVRPKNIIFGGRFSFGKI